MKKCKRYSFLLVFTMCLISAFSFLKSSAVSSQKNEIRTNPNKEYQITYELNGGQFEGEYPKTFKISQETAIPNPTMEGSEFLGWTINNNTNIAPVKDYKIPSMTQGDVKLTANWKALKTKLMDGQIFNSTIKGMSGFENVTEIRFVQETPNPNGVNVAIEGEARAYIEGNVLTVASEGEIMANPDCSKMFKGCEKIKNINLSNFDTSNTTDMSYMFYYCRNLTDIVGIENFSTSQVTNMNSMFTCCDFYLIDLNLKNWDTSKVTDMGNMFEMCYSLTSLDLSNWDTSQVTNMNSMFANCRQLTSLDLSSFNTRNVTNMKGMFSGSDSLLNLNISTFDTSKVTDMSSMFENCTKLSGSITIMNPNVTSYSGMFRYCSTNSSAKFIVKYTDDTTKEIAKQMVATKYDGTTVGNVFLWEKPSTLVNGQTFNSKISAIPNFDKVVEIRFVKGTPNVNGVDVSEAQDGSIKAYIEGTVLTIASEGEIFANSDCTNMFNQYGYTLGTNKKINKITFNNFNTSKVTNMDSMFRFCNLLTNLDLSNFNTSQVTSMDSMFRGCYVLREIKGLENFNTSKVTNTINMFYNCADLIGEVTIQNQYLNNYTSMFTGCSTNTGSKFIVKYISPETKEVARQMVATKMEGNNVFLYEETSILPEGQKFNDKIKSLSSFTNVTKVIFDYGIPSDISKYPNVDISENGNIMGYINGDTLYIVSNGNIIANTNSARLFTYCYNLRSIDFTNNFDTSQITQMNSMFETCTNLIEIKGLEKWNTSQVKDISYMFVGCRNLQNVNVTKFNTSKITNMDYTFKECNKLSGEITISNINTNYYREIFKDCSTDPNAKFIVKYTDEAIKAVAERMVATKSYNSNVFLYEPPKPATLMNGTIFNSTILGMSGFENVEEIRFIQATPKSGGIDVSETRDKSIIASIEGTILTVACEGEIFANKSCVKMFYYMKNLKSINFNNFNTSQATNMSEMFSVCSSLTSLDISNFNTSQVTDMSNMFEVCQKLTEIVGLEKWDTSQVTDMHNMFFDCNELQTLNISNFNNSNVINTSGMFSSCYKLTNLNLDSFNIIPKCVNTSNMFSHCYKINSSITISANSSVVTYYNMFQGCSTDPSAKFIVNYTSRSGDLAQKMVDTKNPNSNVFLGTEVGVAGDIPNKEEPSIPDTVTLTIKDGNTTITKEILAGEIGSLNTPSKEGMIFNGYFYDSEFTKPVSERDVISKDTTIYIKWEETPQVEEIPQEENKDESLEVA